MDVRGNGNPVLVSARRWLAGVNTRHPWNHNEHFHRWILRNLVTGVVIGSCDAVPVVDNEKILSPVLHNRRPRRRGGGHAGGGPPREEDSCSGRMWSR
jgi:hypothetical protein